MNPLNRQPSPLALVSENPYALESITLTQTPPESTDPLWHCYVIRQGENRIVGQRRGSADAVRAAALALVDKLNDRRTVRSARVDLKIGPARR